MRNDDDDDADDDDDKGLAAVDDDDDEAKAEEGLATASNASDCRVLDGEFCAARVF